MLWVVDPGGSWAIYYPQGFLTLTHGLDKWVYCVIFLNQLALSGRIPVPAIAVSESSFTQPNSAVSQRINSQMRSPLYSNLSTKYFRSRN